MDRSKERVFFDCKSERRWKIWAGEQGLYSPHEKMQNVRMWNVRIKAVHSRCNANLWQNDGKMNKRKFFHRTPQRFWEFSSSQKNWKYTTTGSGCILDCCWDSPTDQGYFVVFKIVVLIFCVSFVRQFLVLRDIDNELVSHCCQCCCCCERRKVRSARPSWLDESSVCCAKVQTSTQKSKRISSS